MSRLPLSYAPAYAGFRVTSPELPAPSPRGARPPGPRSRPALQRSEVPLCPTPLTLFREDAHAVVAFGGGSAARNVRRLLSSSGPDRQLSALVLDRLGSRDPGRGPVVRRERRPSHRCRRRRRPALDGARGIP